MKNIVEIKGIKITRELPNVKKLESLIANAVSLASTINLREGLINDVTLGVAESSCIQTVTTLLHSASVKCHLSHPPEDIEMKLDSNGNLIYRCYHSPAHEWDLQGNKK